MESYFAPMNEAYTNKHYPDGSVFSAIAKATKKSGNYVKIFFIPLMLLLAAGTAFSVKRLMDAIASGDSEMISPGIFVVCLCVILFIVCLLPVIFTKKRGALGVEGLIKQSAKNSACDESDIREFERQALASDSLVLALTDKVKAALNSQKDGILTRDYIYLADNLNIVMKYSDIIGAFLVKRVIHVTVNNKIKRIDSLTISLLSGKNAQTFVDTSVEAGAELLSFLLDKNPGIETKGGSVIDEKDFDMYCKEMLASAHS